MSNSDLMLLAEKREIIGKKVSSLRRIGKVPAVVHERGQDSVHIMAEIIPLTKLWHAAGKNHVVNLSYETRKQMVMFKDVALDPVKGSISHVAFHAIKQK